MLKPYKYNKKIECGVDEVGRGCLAGPVVAAAVILPQDFTHEWLNDSKQLSEKKRKELRTISFEIDIVIVIDIDIVIDIEIDIDIVIDIEFVIDIEIVIVIVIDIEFALFQFCQSEFISDSVLIEILKQVQHDNVTRGLIGVKRSNLFHTTN